MSRYLIALALIIPFPLSHEYLPFEKEYTNPAFNALLLTCINGGNASIWIDNKLVRYISCQPIPFPKRFPR